MTVAAFALNNGRPTGVGLAGTTGVEEPTMRDTTG
jgi:hypothetical protein